MRKLLKWVIVTVGIAALVRWWKRRESEPAVTAPPAPANEPAEDLRRKLDESREASEPEDAPEPVAETVDERRADVHDQGRAALDEMKPSDEG
jgi:hypothetical protein